VLAGFAEWACKPGSVSCDHLSGTAVADGLVRATRATTGPVLAAPIRPCSRWGLPSRRVTTALVRSYRTVSAFPPTCTGNRGRRAVSKESSFLWHFPSPRGARPLACTLPCGARTFLTHAHFCASARPPSPLRARILAGNGDVRCRRARHRGGPERRKTPRVEGSSGDSLVARTGFETVISALRGCLCAGQRRCLGVNQAQSRRGHIPSEALRNRPKHSHRCMDRCIARAPPLQRAGTERYGPWGHDE